MNASIDDILKVLGEATVKCRMYEEQLKALETENKSLKSQLEIKLENKATENVVGK